MDGGLLGGRGKRSPGAGTAPTLMVTPAFGRLGMSQVINRVVTPTDAMAAGATIWWWALYYCVADPQRRGSDRVDDTFAAS